jgi:hypothetical protein
MTEVRLRWPGFTADGDGLVFMQFAPLLRCSLALGWPLLFVLVVGAVYIYDCIDCGTFSSANSSGI